MGKELYVNARFWAFNDKYSALISNMDTDVGEEEQDIDQ